MPNVAMHDTDSIAISLKDADLIEKSTSYGDELGQWALVANIKNAHFLKPKTYGFIDSDTNEEIVKSSGYPTNIVNIEDLKKLINTSKFLNIKKQFYKMNTNISELKIKNIKYEISLTNEYNTRIKIFDLKNN
jgi:hypothetical protein